jgi:hypothetical protein
VISLPCQTGACALRGWVNPGIFFNEVLLKSPRNRRYANIVQNLYYGKCTRKRDFTLQNFLFQNMCRNLKFLTATKKFT